MMSRAFANTANPGNIDIVNRAGIDLPRKLRRYSQPHRSWRFRFQ